MARKPKPKYNTYSLIKNGKLVGSIPYMGIDGRKKYLRKTFDEFEKASDNQAALDKWVLQERAKLAENDGVFKVEKATTFAEVATWYKELYLVPARIENGVRIDGIKNWRSRRATLDFVTEYFGGVAQNKLTHEESKDSTKVVRYKGGSLLNEIRAAELKK